VKERRVDFSRDYFRPFIKRYAGSIRAALRPYPRKVAGIPLEMSFDIKRRLFEFTFQHDEAVTAPTELYIPGYQYPSGFRVIVSDGEFHIDGQNQTLFYLHGRKLKIHHISVRE
jgi:hypothetical protein